MTPFQILKKALIGRKIYVQKPSVLLRLFKEHYKVKSIKAEIIDCIQDENELDRIDLRVKTIETSEEEIDWVEVLYKDNLTFVEDVIDIDNNQKK